MSGPRQMLASLSAMRRDPDEPTNAARARDILETLSRRRRPRGADLAMVAEHAQLFCTLGLAESARALLRRMRAAGLSAARADVADAVLTLSIDPKGASSRLRELAARDPDLAAYETVRCFLRGDVLRAGELVVAHRGFVGSIDSTHALSYGVVSLALSERFDDARSVLAEHRARWARCDPTREVSLLRAEGMVASYENHHAEALAAMEEALALAREHGLGDARVYTEANVAVLLARSGDLDRAEALVRSFPPPRDPPTELDAYRDLARLELALFSSEHAAAGRIALRGLGAAEATGKVVVQSLLRFALALSAPPSRFGAALGDYARIVHHHRIPFHVTRLRLLERLGRTGVRSFRDVRPIERTRGAATKLPLVRAFSPTSATLGADLYVDTLHDTVRVRGRGPLSLGTSPTRAGVLRELVASPTFSVPVADLFERVWGMPYDPIRHETKVHVTLHRLRASLGDPALVEVSDGRVGFPDGADVRVLALEASPDRIGAATVDDRVCELLRAGALSPRALEGALGVSRSTLHASLRRLLGSGRIGRAGRGPTTRYRLDAT